MKRAPELGLEAIENVFQAPQLRNLDYCYVTGGEPYISDKIVDIATLLHKYLPNCLLTGATNGIDAERIFERVLKIRDAGCKVQVQVSLNGSRTTHDATRGGAGYWDKAVGLINKLTAHSIDTIAAFSMMPQTAKDLPYMQRFCLARGIPMEFVWVRQSERYGEVDERFSTWPEAVKEGLRLIENLPEFFECPSLQKRLVITPDGSVYPCEVYRPELLLGNVNERPLEDILCDPHTAEVAEMIAARACSWCQGPGEVEGSPKWMVMDCYRRQSPQAMATVGKSIQARYASPDVSDKIVARVLAPMNLPPDDRVQEGHSPDMSVLLCSFNRADTLKRCLQALEEQTISPDRFEVVCVNDGSTDDTRQVMREALGHLPGSYQEHAENRGLAAARNTALRAARGKYLLFINDDTYPEADLLEQHLQAHQVHDGQKVAVLGHVSFAPEHAERILSQALYQYNLLFPMVGTREDVAYGFDHFVTGNVSVARRAFLDEDVWFDESFRQYGCEDIEVGYRLWQRGYRVYYNPRAKVMHDHHLTVADYQRREAANGANLIQFLDKHPELVPHYLGVPRLTEAILTEWRKRTGREASKITHLVHQVAALEDVTPALAASPSNAPSRTAVSVQQVGQALMDICKHTKLTAVLQALDDLPEVRQRLLSGPPRSDVLIGPGTPGLTSIIVLNLNGAAHIRKCVESIRIYTKAPYELIVVDNGSSDGSLEYLRSLPEIKLIENTENVGAPFGRNQGLAVAEGEYIVFLDNDTVVTEGWLGRLIACAKANGFDALGPMSNYVSGPQLVRNPDYSDPEGLQAFSREWAGGNAGRASSVGQLILFCLFVKREVIRKIGGFDPLFEKWGWEDDDFGLRAQIAGFHLGIVHDVYIHHTGSQTSRTANINYDALLE